MTIPVQLDQLLTLALGVVFLTQVLKRAASALDKPLDGKGAVAVSALVAAALTAVGYAAGWVPLPNVPNLADYADPFSWAGAWLVTAGGVLALANVLYAAVYSRVFGRAEPSG